MAEGPYSSWASASQTGTQVKKEALPRLLNLLSPVAYSWKLFVGQIGVPSTKVSEIDATNARIGPNWLFTCFQHAMEWWVANCHPTYEAIIAVLDPTSGQITHVMNRDLAHQVKEFMAKEQGATSQPKDDFTQGNDFFIRGKFANLLEFVQMKLQDQLRPEEIETKLRSFVLRIFGSIPANYIPVSSNVAEIFEAMTSNNLLTYWNYFPLEEIIKNFSNDDSEMKSKMEQYKKDRSGFQLATKIKDYIPKARSRFPFGCDEPASKLQPKRTPAYLTQLAITLEDGVADFHLDYLEELWRSLSNVLSLPPLYLLLDAIIMDSVLVVWLIPSDRAPKATEKALQSTNFFNRYPIVKVTIGDECVYERESLVKAKGTPSWTSGTGDGGDKELETSAQPQSKDSGSEAPVSAESTPAQVDESAKLQKLASKTIIFVIGGPGSGKGTHCSRIAKDFGFTHLSAGELLREEKKKGNERGRLIQEKMEEGLLVPPEITIGLLKTALLSHPDAVGFLIDGFPRDLGQGKLFVQQVCECSLMLMFECGDDVMMRRVLKRGKTSERVDDNEESMQERLKNFHQDIIPILEHYQSMGKVKKINSDRSIEEVYSDVHAVLREITTQGDTSLATPT